MISNVLDRMLPMGKAATMLGVDTRTLRRWLEHECGLVFPRLGRGASPLVRVGDIQKLIANRQGKQKYSPAMGPSGEGFIPPAHRTIAPLPEPLIAPPAPPIISPSASKSQIQNSKLQTRGAS
jgi:hypothetical protein